MIADVVPVLPLAELSRLLSQREISATELARGFLDRIEAANAHVNALMFVDPDGAMAEAQAAEERYARQQSIGVLDGLSLVLKDNIAVARWPLTNGLAVKQISRCDASVVARLRQEGAVILGSANMDEGALGADGVNPHYGRIENPGYPGYSVGGSSGGSAAAVAAGFCCAALGTDTLGSVRLPAAYCGLVGFKPSHGRLPMTGIVPLMPDLDAVGPLIRSVADAIHVMTPLAQWQISSEKLKPNRLRWGVPDGFSCEALQPDVRASFEAALADLSVATPPRSVDLPHWDPGAVRRAGFLLSEHHAAHHWPDFLRATDDVCSERMRSMLAFARSAGIDRLDRARGLVRQAARELLTAFKDVDMIVIPTASQTAFPETDSAPPDQADFTAMANVAGCPAISIPCPTAAGLPPAGLQLIGSPGSDERLLASALQVETLLDGSR